MLTQQTVTENCEIALKKYSSMNDRNARLCFSYELQGFIAYLVKTKNVSLVDAVELVEDLIYLVRKANSEE